VTFNQQIRRALLPTEWKVTSYTVFGILFFVLGVAALIQPNFAFPAKRSEVVIANRRVVLETRKVISIPRAASAAEVVLGIGLVFFGSRKLR
jgi:hypothetical protein